MWVYLAFMNDFPWMGISLVIAILSNISIIVCQVYKKTAVLKSINFVESSLFPFV